MSKLTREELMELIEEAKKTGDWSAVEQADVSCIEDFSRLFMECKGIDVLDLSRWDVSNGRDFSYMFACSHFNGDVSQWDVSNGRDFSDMFACSKFNGDISKWNVGSGRNFSYMFACSPFDTDLSNWSIQEDASTANMFFNAPLLQVSTNG